MQITFRSRYQKNERSNRIGRKPEFRKNNPFQRTDRCPPACGKLSGRYRGKNQGTYSDKSNNFTIVELPGTYSLTAYSLEEVVVRDFIVNEKLTMIVNIVDASNLERNLYLTTQFLEMGIPVCIALNMMDVAKKRGISINIEKLSSLLRIPVVPTIARSGKGKKQLMNTVAEFSETKTSPLDISYGRDIDEVLDRMEKTIHASGFLTKRYRPRWTALKHTRRKNTFLLS